jgi:hypothetical protein
MQATAHRLERRLRCAIIIMNGPELADLFFRVAALGLRSHVGQALSFDQVGYAPNPASTNTSGRNVR